MTFERCELVKDLGILFDIKLSFIDHIVVAKSASIIIKILEFIIRNCNNFSSEQALKTYFAYVQSKLGIHYLYTISS